MKRAGLAVLLIALVVAVTVGLGRRAAAPDVPPAPGAKDGHALARPAGPGLFVDGLSDPEIVLNVQDAGEIVPPMEKSEAAGAVNGWCLTVPEGPDHTRLNPADKPGPDGQAVPNGTAAFKFTVAQEGAYYLWAHKWWSCSCGKSFRLSLDGAPFFDFITDSNYQVWEWASQKRPHRLAAGPHTLVLANRENGFCVDRFLFTMGQYTPAPPK